MSWFLTTPTILRTCFAASFVALASTIVITSAAKADSAPQVVTDIAPVQALVARVMQGVETPQRLVNTGDSAHAFSLRPSQAKAIQEADLIVWIGPDMSPWLEEAVEALSSNGRSMALMALPQTSILPFREDAVFEHDDHHDEHHDEHGKEHDDHHDEHHDEHGKEHDDHHDEHHDEHGKEHDDHHDEHHDEHGKEHVDHHDEHGKEHDDHHDEHGKEHDDHHDEHAKHDDHAGHHHDGDDPHVWLDPENAKTWLSAIAVVLADIDPVHADLYAANAAAGADEIDAAMTPLATRLASVKDKPFMVYHDAYQYFEAHFGLQALGAVTAGDAAEPGPARLAAIADLVAERVAETGSPVCILVAPNESDRFLASLEGNVRAVRAAPFGTAKRGEAETRYDLIMATLADAVADCLEG